MKSHIVDKKNISVVNAKDLTDITDEIESLYLDWLAISEISEEYLLDVLNKNDFEISMVKLGDVVYIALEGPDGNFAEPFGWNPNANIEYKEFIMNFIYLLKLIANKCTNQQTIEKLGEYMKTLTSFL